MKTQMKLLSCFIIVPALLSAPRLASAYYDPGVQRWINRDPLGDHTVALKQPRLGPLRVIVVAERTQGPNLNSLARNDAMNAWDPYGLEVGIEYPTGGGGREKPPDINYGRCIPNSCRLGCMAAGAACSYACFKLGGASAATLICMELCVFAADWCYNHCPAYPPGSD
jgi:hypothetical protein